MVVNQVSADWKECEAAVKLHFICLAIITIIWRVQYRNTRLSDNGLMGSGR